MKRFNSKRVILFLVVLTFLVTSICKISIFAATGNILAISEVVKTFDEGKLVKVKDGDIVKDIIVLNNGTIEDYDASKHSKYFKDSKISKVLKEKKDKLSDNAMISVSIWLTDIDMEKVEKTVKDKLSITDITKETDEKIQKFIEDKRAAAAIEYKIKNEKFYSKYVKAENILFTSSYAPYIVANVEKKVVDNLEKDNEVAYLDIFENSKKVEEVASSIPQ